MEKLILTKRQLPQLVILTQIVHQICWNIFKAFEGNQDVANSANCENVEGSLLGILDCMEITL